MEERLQKILSQWGLASRRHAEQLLQQGRVRVNGVVAHIGQKANPDRDAITVDGLPLQDQQRPQDHYLLIHKPLGVLSTCHDPQGRTTVLDLLPPPLRQGQGLHPVGRLDSDSTGALLLTNDGQLTLQLTHPRHQLAKIYEVWVSGHPSSTVLKQWRQGVWLEGRKTLPTLVHMLRSSTKATLLKITLWEGRNRQIRKVADLLGHPVIKLHRTHIGPISLGNLPVGSYRFLREDELNSLCVIQKTAVFSDASV